MAVWNDIMTRFTAGYKAFRKPDLISEPLAADADFNSFDSRRIRYSIFWAFYENSVYDEVAVTYRNWARQYKTDYGLYKYIRNIYNPSYRLGEFWKAHLWAGETIPIEAEALTDGQQANLMAALAQLWQWSNWNIKKDIVPLYGSILGDVAISIVDDPVREVVYMDVIHPGTIAEIDTDPQGNVKGYIIKEQRLDPRNQRAVEYTEIVERAEGDNIRYTTLLDGAPFPWNGEMAEWEKPYGFVPMVLIKHNEVGLQWGWSEILPGQSKFREVDDQASILNDQIRKMKSAPFLFTGVSAPTSSPEIAESSLTGTAAANRPQPGREEQPALYAGSDANAIPLVMEMDLEDNTANIAAMVKEIERDFPELRLMALDEQGSNISGRALRLARQPAETKVTQRRAGYYDALVRAQQMALSIGGFNGYANFEPFSIDSFKRGELDHSIGEMPIFNVDPLDKLEIVKEQAVIIQTMTNAGSSLEQAAIFSGMTEEEAAALSQVDLSILER